MALRPWVRPIAYCEIDTYCQGVLLSRMSGRELPVAPIWDDVQTLKGAYFKSDRPDIIYGGYPCQDISVAGTGAGLDGDRSRLFFEIVRLVGELRPRFVFLENVPAITTRGGVRVISEFARLGYDCRWTIVSAAEMGAPHIRKRWFLLAHTAGIMHRPAELSGIRLYAKHQRQVKKRRVFQKIRGPLNPKWIEWIMGYPLEWTALNPWAMQWFQSKRGKRLKD